MLPALHATLPLAVGGFVAGIGLVVLATERLVDGLVGLALALRVAPFVVAAVVSGMEAENVAVGLAAGARGAANVALGTAYGGAIVLLCWALGLGAVLAPLRVRLPRAAVLLVPSTAILAGLPACFPVTPRWTGAVLLAGFPATVALLYRATRRQASRQGEEVEEAPEAHRLPRIVGWTLIGLALIAIGGDVVAWSAEGLIATLGLSAGFIGMVVTPLGIEAEEIVRQVIPARRGRPDVSAGNAIGTVLWFLLFNLGLIALVTPVPVPQRVRALDWPALVVAACLAAAFLWRGRLGRAEGALLLAVGLAYAVLQLVVR